MKAIACILVATLASVWASASASALEITFDDLTSIANPVVVQGKELVPSRGQPHRAMAVDGARPVDEAPRQIKVELRPQRRRCFRLLCRARVCNGRQAPAHQAGSQPSWAIVSFSVSTLVSPAFRVPISRDLAQQLVSL